VKPDEKNGSVPGRDKRKKGVFTRILDWIARGVKQAEKKGQAPCRS
jgi:hypothetical protein